MLSMLLFPSSPQAVVDIQPYTSQQGNWFLYLGTSVEQFIINNGGTSVSWQSPGADTFSDSTWNANVINPYYLLMTGAESTIFPDKRTWIEYFSGTPSTQNFYVDSFVYDSSSTLLEDLRFQWNGSNWALTFITLDPSSSIYDRTPSGVPEPSSLLLLGAGLAGLWVAGRKKVERR